MSLMSGDVSATVLGAFLTALLRVSGRYETAGRVIPLQWRGCLLMISVLIATAGSGANDFYRSSLN